MSQSKGTGISASFFHGSSCRTRRSSLLCESVSRAAPVVNSKPYKLYARGMGGTAATAACLLLGLVGVNYGKAVKATRREAPAQIDRA